MSNFLGGGSLNRQIHTPKCSTNWGKTLKCQTSKVRWILVLKRHIRLDILLYMLSWNAALHSSSQWTGHDKVCALIGQKFTHDVCRGVISLGREMWICWSQTLWFFSRRIERVEKKEPERFSSSNKRRNAALYWSAYFMWDKHHTSARKLLLEAPHNKACAMSSF